MELNLVYIAGISDVDTLNFATKVDRDNYFDGLLSSTIRIETFYPPHYTNEIKVDTDDIDFDTNVNYLWFEYNNIRYFYFIEGIKYTSENVITLSVRLDTFMTYRFNLNIYYAYIERKFIPRFVDHKINRSYIRENYSTGNFKVDTCKYYYRIQDYYSHRNDRNLLRGLFVFKNSDDLEEDTAPGLTTFRHSNRYDTKTLDIHSEYYYYYIPFNENADLFVNPDVGVSWILGVSESLNWLCQAETAFSAFFMLYPINSDITVNLSVVEGETHYVYNFRRVIIGDESYATTGDIGGPNQASRALKYRYINYDYVPIVDKHIDTIPAMFEMYVDTSEHTFTWKDVPALFDENYIRYSFGESDVVSLLPLYQLTDMDIYVCQYGDYFNGCRYYRFYYTEPTEITGTVLLDKDFLGTLTVAETPITLDIINNPGKNWFNMNKGSFISALGTIGGAAIGFAAGQLPGAMTGAAKAAAATSAAAEKPLELTATKENAAGRFEFGHAVNSMAPNPQTKFTSTKTIYPDFSDILHRHDEKPVEYTSIIGDKKFDTEITGHTKRTIEQAANAVMAKNQGKLSGSYTTDLPSQSFIPRFTIEIVTDIVQVAWRYHLNGYRVDEIFNGGDLVSYVTTRKFFNILKVYEIDFSLNILGSSDILSELAARFKKGLRLWNPAYTIGSNLHLDNTEVS